MPTDADLEERAIWRLEQGCGNDSRFKQPFDIKSSKLYPHDLLVFLKTHRVHTIMKDGLQEAVLRDTAGQNSSPK
jgi:hypothetical protein